MADTSNILKFPLVRAAQVQKEITVNEALVALEAVTQLKVWSVLSTPPEDEIVGDRYIVGINPEGDWVSFSEHDVVVAIEGGWRAFTPLEGWEAYLASSGRRVRFVGGSWQVHDIAEGRLDVGVDGSGTSIDAADLSKVRFLSVLMAASGTATLPEGVTGIRHVRVDGDGFTLTIGGVDIAGGSSAVIWLVGDGTAETV